MTDKEIADAIQELRARRRGAIQNLHDTMVHVERSSLYATEVAADVALFASRKIAAREAKHWTVADLFERMEQTARESLLEFVISQVSEDVRKAVEGADAALFGFLDELEGLDVEDEG